MNGKKNLRRERRFVTLRLLPEDRDLLQNLGRGRPDVEDRFAALCELKEIIPTLNLPDIRGQKRRTVRLALPSALEESINRVVELTGQPFVAVLLAAAAEYQRRHAPNPDGREDEPPLPEARRRAPRHSRPDQRYVTLRLLEEDQALLKGLGRSLTGIPDRYAALAELPQIISEMTFADVRDRERRPFRLGIPAELEETVNEVVERTGQPFLTVVLAAAREYRRRYPLPPESESPP